jgi:magnesium chelatase family protein
MSSRQIRQFCPLDEECRHLLKSSVNEMGLSARAHDKVMRVARTIADLDTSEPIRATHIQEAVNFRTLDRQMWS